MKVFGRLVLADTEGASRGARILEELAVEGEPNPAFKFSQGGAVRLRTGVDAISAFRKNR
ncbi:MAG: hypothetical protein KGM43_09980 [Planctomycetota bacterium]|nr:hypothetical protein [Planctomycetota bacterium]